MSPGNPFILGSKRYTEVKVTGHKNVTAWSLHSSECWLLLVNTCTINMDFDLDELEIL